MVTKSNAHQAGRGWPGAGLARPLRTALFALVLALQCSAANAVLMCAAGVGAACMAGDWSPHWWVACSVQLPGCATRSRGWLAPQAGGGLHARRAASPCAGPSPVAGNPVDLVTGAKLDRAVDVHVPAGAGAGAPALRPGPPPELLFSRMYSSMGTGSDALGPGWRHGFETRLHAGQDARGRAQLQVLQADGRLVRFGAGRRTLAGPLRHEGLHRDDGVLERLPHRAATAARATAAATAATAQAATWIWRWRDGRRLEFSADGRLLAVADLGAARLSLEYEPEGGRLTAVRDAAGNALRLVYGDRDQAGVGALESRVETQGGLRAAPAQRLAVLRLPDGSQVRYGYDARGRLESVRHPGGDEVRYRYDAQGAARLVGVTLPDGRSSAYRYDAQGRWSGRGPLGRRSGRRCSSITSAAAAAATATAKPGSRARTGCSAPIGGERSRTARPGWWWRRGQRLRRMPAHRPCLSLPPGPARGARGGRSALAAAA
jgi:YD repeat-containing protein